MVNYKDRTYQALHHGYAGTITGRSQIDKPKILILQYNISISIFSIQKENESNVAIFQLDLTSHFLQNREREPWNPRTKAIYGRI